MFETIKGIIGDIAAGAIKDQRIALSQEQLTVLDARMREALEQLGASRRENTRLSQRVAELEQLVEDRDAQISQLTVPGDQPRNGRRSETDEKILLLLTNGRELTARQIASQLGISLDRTEVHLAALRDAELVYHHSYIRLEFEPERPNEWYLTNDGKRYLAKHDLIK
jgi:DNA-binding transcriptional ArsR family regulator